MAEEGDRRVVLHVAKTPIAMTAAGMPTDVERQACEIEFSEREKGTNTQSFSEFLVNGVFRYCERSQVIKIGLVEGIAVK